MSLILALDSSTDACSVALNVHGEVLSQFEIATKSHTQRLLPMVDELLVSTGHSLCDLDAIAFGRGPGSFTGLRICMGVVQGLAFGANLPVLPVSTLEAMAVGYYRQHQEDKRPLLTALDARMNEVYWAMYGRDQDYTHALTLEQVMKPEAIVDSEQLQSHNGNFVALGSGWNYEKMHQLKPERVVLDVCPRAEDIASIAGRLFSLGKAIHIVDAQPVYLRDSVSWQKRQRIRVT